MSEILGYINFAISAITLLIVVYKGGKFVGKTDEVLVQLINKHGSQNKRVESLESIVNQLKEQVIILKTLSGIQHGRRKSESD